MDTPFRSALQAFLNYLSFEKRYSPHTVVAYQNDLEQFFSYMAGQYGLSSLDGIAGTAIRSWLAELKEEKMTAKTINRKVSSLKSFFKYTLEQVA